MMPSGAGLDAIFRLSRTRTNYWLEFVLDAALGVAFLSDAIRRHVSVYAVVLLVLVGLFAFSFMEYVFHRWLFHGRETTLLARGHAAHHADPRGYDSLPFFLPALVLLCVAGAGALAMPVADALLVASGIAFGYITYGLSHFFIHHGRYRRPWIRRWAARHHIHHHHLDRNFGVTSPLWDLLLGTRYVRPTSTAGTRSPPQPPAC